MTTIFGCHSVIHVVCLCCLQTANNPHYLTKPTAQPKIYQIKSLFMLLSLKVLSIQPELPIFPSQNFTLHITLIPRSPKSISFAKRPLTASINPWHNANLTKKYYVLPVNNFLNYIPSLFLRNLFLYFLNKQYLSTLGDVVGLVLQ